MYSYVVACITIMMLFCEIDSVPHHRNRHVRRERRYEISHPAIQTDRPMQSASTFFPLAYPISVTPLMSSNFPNAPNSVVPPAYNYNPRSEASPIYNIFTNKTPVNYTSAPFLPTPLSQYSYHNPPQIIARRRKKNIPEKNIKLKDFLEKGKEILEMTTEKQISGGKALVGNQRDSGEGVDEEETDEYVTIAAIPKGIQLKTASKHNKNHVEKVLNISSSTATIQTLDNTTEVENVVEMQMEKKLEDDKGENKGLEKVRIVETELVKPVVKGKMHSGSHKKRRRHMLFRKFEQHRRSKRSNTDFEVLRSVSHFHNKIRKFPLDFKRKERIVERNNLLNRREASCSKGYELLCTTSNFRETTTEITRDESSPETDEMGDFLKHFFSQLKKLKKARESDKNNPQNMTYTNITDGKWYGPRLMKYRNNKFPEHLKLIMNLNMTLDTNTRNSFRRSPNTPEKFRNDIEHLRSTDISTQATTPQRALKVLFVNDRKETNSNFLSGILLLLIVIILLPVLACVVPKLYRTAQLAHGDFVVEGYRVYRGPLNIKSKAQGSFRGENIRYEEVSPLEWQDIDGEWRSEKELEIKEPL